MTVDPTFGAAHSIQLDTTSWVEHIPGWLTGSEQLLAALIASAGWQRETDGWSTGWSSSRASPPSTPTSPTRLNRCWTRQQRPYRTATACRTTGSG
jgi:hypothetical protein